MGLNEFSVDDSLILTPLGWEINTNYFPYSWSALAWWTWQTTSGAVLLPPEFFLASFLTGSGLGSGFGFASALVQVELSVQQQVLLFWPAWATDLTWYPLVCCFVSSSEPYVFAVWQKDKQNNVHLNFQRQITRGHPKDQRWNTHIRSTSALSATV